MKEIWVVSTDWRFRALVHAELRERGYTARGFETLADAAVEFGSEADSPIVLVLDAADADGAVASEQVTPWTRRGPVILVLSAAEAARQAPPGVRVLCRPLQIEDVVAHVIQCAGPSD